ncbi:hypothetical protein V6N11_068602 [Hibiscus sabdariffa]|uniref:Uncharacterized protein n=1 Tax=Hibiscus sabdariffa TaxID=183260 RepID=A0ABR2PAI4_9ROSI
MKEDRGGRNMQQQDQVLVPAVTAGVGRQWCMHGRPEGAGKLHCVDIVQFGFPLVELVIDLLVITNKIECSIDGLAQQQLQKHRNSSLPNESHGRVRRKKGKREMKKQKENSV